MFQKVTTVVLIGTALVLAACNTVRGAARTSTRSRTAPRMR